MATIRQIAGRIVEFFSTGSNALSRNIRVAASFYGRPSWSRPAIDWTRPDYDFWRRAYYGRARGLELSGLFIRPLVNKVAAWTLGMEPSWSCENEASQEALAEWWAEWHPLILRGWRSALRQGDMFAIVNADATLTLLPPETVTPLVDEADFSNITGWRVTHMIRHPERAGERMTIYDEYRRTERTRWVEVNGVEVERQTYPNLIGRLPIVHIANGLDDGDRFGHAEAEPLVEVLHRYGEILEAGIDGNRRQGRPTPVLTFETVEQLDKFWVDNSSRETQTLPDGTSETTSVLDVDLSQLLTVAGAEFAYAAPGAFAGDTAQLLELMFYLILEHTELPEFVFGNAISSSKASAETQMPVFVRFITMKRGEMAGWLMELAEVALAYLALLKPGVVEERPGLQFDQLEGDDGRLTLEAVKWAYAEGLLDRRTALTLAPVDVDDIDGVLEAARQEREERARQMGDPTADDRLAIFRREVERIGANGTGPNGFGRNGEDDE
jgi:hypothetical protein